MRRLALVLLGCLGLATAADAQRTLRGVVLGPNGAPVAGANVFIIETLDGAVADSAGRWTFETTHAGRGTLVARATGYAEVRRPIELPNAGALTITLGRGSHALAPTTVVASRYAASDDAGATLSTLDVVATPGTNADVMRALQTLPGIQAVDEGTALYVRGGDHTETHVLVNGAVMSAPFAYESPNGTFIGTVDPFLLDGIHFSSGGFGARHGNVLSAVADLHTLGLPRRNTASATAGLAALSASFGTRVTPTLGVRAALNEFDTGVLFRVNGSTVRYQTPPRGHDRTGSVIWNYRPTGEVKAFGITQATNLTSLLEDPSHVGAYAMEVRSHLAVLNWRDVFNRWSPSLRVSDTRMRRAQDYGAFRLGTGQRFSGASSQLDWAATGGLTLRAGAEWERMWSDITGSIPDESHDKSPDARITTVDGHPHHDRIGAFGEADLLMGARTRLVAGLRRDRTSSAADATLDPRLSAALTIVKGVVATAAWGIYHQVPDPILLDSTLGDPTLPSMRARHAVVGVQAGSAGQMARVELFDKQYSDLAQVTRNYDAVGGGAGSARGVDMFFSGTGWTRMRWRTSVSSLVARRRDPDTGIMAPAPYDVSTSVTAVINQTLTPGWHTGLTWRHATGRPYTPVTGASFDAAGDVWVPTHGAPMSERLPAFRRLDASVTRLQRIGGNQAVFFFAINNLLDRENIHAYRYTSDYSRRIAVRSLFKRSVYFGASLTR